MRRLYEKVVIPYSATDDTGTSDGITGLEELSQGLNNVVDDSNGDDDVGDGTQDQPQNQDQQQQDTQQQQQQQMSSKANHAFGQMRTQIKDQQELLYKAAQAMGIEYKDMADLTAKLNDEALTRQATAQNVPKELLERLNQLEGIARVSKEQEYHL